MNRTTIDERQAGGVPEDRASDRDGPPMHERVLTRHEAIPLIGLAALAIGTACDLERDPVAARTPDPQDALARARVHRGGIQRFALQHKADGVAVRVADADTGPPGSLTVTVYEANPKTGGLLMGPGGPRVLELHEGVTNATISQIESPYFVFYYVGMN